MKASAVLPALRRPPCTSLRQHVDSIDSGSGDVSVGAQQLSHSAIFTLSFYLNSEAKDVYVALTLDRASWCNC